MKRLTILLAVLSCACESNMEKAKPSSEDLGARFVVEATASTDTGYSIYVLRDKANGNLIYLTPQSGVYVQEQQ